MKFDFVIGNPPYNGKRGNRQGSLYALIWSKVLGYLKENGESVCIHPTGWRWNDEKSIELSTIYKSGYVKADLHTTLFCRYIWNVVANVDVVYFKNNKTPKTLIRFEDLSTEKKYQDLTDYFVYQNKPIPTMYFDIFRELLEYSENKPKIKIHRPKTRKIQKHHKKTDVFKYPVIEKIPKKHKFEKGEGILYTDTPPLPEEKQPKIILSWGSLHNLLDLEGKYQATSQRNKYIYGNKDELIELYKVLDFLPFKLFMQSVMGSDQRVLYDQVGRKLDVLEMFSTDFGKKFFEIYEKNQYNDDTFYHSVSEIKKSGVYDKYVMIAKKGATWAENKRLK